jgi:YidC/Oxa1 family membrane protein insertase
MGDLFNAILRPLEYCVAWIMVSFHNALTAIGMPEKSGWTWGLSIVGLVVIIRILLIPLFVKQIKASRGMQLIQPEMKKIQEKYKGRTDQASRQAMTQETMELYKRTGTNPFSSCMPLLLQSPVFFALFRVLNYNIGNQKPIGPLTSELAAQADNAQLLGSPLSATFMGTDIMATKILTVVLIVLMSASTFTTQRQLMMKNMPAAALDNPIAQQQKVLLYVLPLVFAVSGVNFPIGVLIYWLVTNVWSMGQQFYVIRRMPAPGSPAEKALMERRARRGHVFGPKSSPEDEPETSAESSSSSRQRQQPKRQPKSKRSSSGSGSTRTTSGASAPGSQGQGSTQPAVKSGSGAKSTSGKGRRPTKRR